MKRYLILILLCVSCAGQATVYSPVTISIKDDHQAEVRLSNVDINRLFVKGEKITSIQAPSGKMTAHNDTSGSVYLDVNGTIPFTAFVSTDTGRHFSLLIVPKSEPGQTIRLLAATPEHFHYTPHSLRARHYEQASPYETTLIKLLKTTMLGKIPPGYTNINIHAFHAIPCMQIKPLDLDHHIQQEVTTGYLGGAFAVRILNIKNNARHTIALHEADFASTGVRAISMEDDHIEPHAKLRIYEVVSND